LTKTAFYDILKVTMVIRPLNYKEYRNDNNKKNT
jgi:hypothetical protein